MSNDEIGIARKARAASEEAAELRAENKRLVEMLDAIRSNSASTDIKPDAVPKCPRCVSVWVDIKKRVVECRRCGAKLDPLDVLHEFATEERRFLQWNVHARQELERMRIEAGSLKRDIARARTERIECPRGCRKFVAVSLSHPHGVTPHACYGARARLHLVPRVAEERWRVLFVEGASRWTNLMAATRTATNTEGARVEEFAGPIGEKAERARDRAEHERQWREKMAGRRAGVESKPIP